MTELQKAIYTNIENERYPSKMKFKESDLIKQFKSKYDNEVIKIDNPINQSF